MIGSVFESRLKRGDFAFLRVDRLVECFVPGGHRPDAFIFFVKLGGDQLHLRAEDFEGLVDIPKRGLKILLALNAYA